MSKQADEIKELERSRWKCLKRSSEYQADYSKYIGLCNKLYLFNMVNAVLSKERIFDEIELKKLVDEINLLHLFEPASQLDVFDEIHVKKMFNFRDGIFSQVHALEDEIFDKYGIYPQDPNNEKGTASPWRKGFNAPAFKLTEFLIENRKCILDNKVLMIAIDLAQDKKYILPFVHQLINEEQERLGFRKYKQPVNHLPSEKMWLSLKHMQATKDSKEHIDTNINNELTKQRRSHIKIIDRDLRIWDLKQEGKTPDRIAQIVFKDKWDEMLSMRRQEDDGAAYDKSLDIETVLIQRVNDSYKRINELIDGGFKDLR